jgi:DNA-directed RNA polymerase subunit L
MATAFSDFRETGNKLEFKITNVDLSVVNSLRRIILSEIPCVAFYFDPYDQENVHINIKVNTGVLHNEFLSHRLSLIPLYFTKDEIDTFDPEQYKFVLKKKNTTNDVILVTTKDFEIFDKEGEKLPEEVREKLFPKNKITGDYILITKLRPNLYSNEQGEEIDIDCKATVGTAQQHARWCGVSQCAFYNTVDPVSSQKAYQEMIKEVSKEEEKKITARFEALDKYRHFKKNKYDEPSEFDFVLQSECGMTPREIVSKAFQILQEKVKAFQDNLEKLMVTPIGDTGKFFQLTIPGENHTLLNVLQCLTYNKCFRNPENPIEYIGYYQSHPLDNTMYLKVRFLESNQDLKEFISKHCSEIVDYIKLLSTQFA